MRWIASIGIAAGLSVALFLFMISLITTDQVRDTVDQVITQLSFVEPPPPEPETPEPPPPQEQADPEPEQPATETLSVVSPPTSPRLNQHVADSPLPPADWAPDLNISAAGAGWAGQVGGLSLNEGEEGKGYVEVIPLATRRPNIPEIAWQNKIDGWVLVAFTLKTDGHTKNIRVMDSHPRGIYEETVIKAVQGWLYDINSMKTKGEIILTQRIELNWKHYPENYPYVD
ncbi:TonB family protein [Ketobacter sp. MCCC 1A13808]|uniref:TonB family protein n=1 Tax=Ketobacter sp. MCCC 1A13808 TaxID=2602738 RepID=UPI0012EB1CC4|nr:TonB family protein [Ketobacter sp. MCCC 1A13808]MVF13263.1 TonB family protein [Ketobacter sp. MCCC 1A13808]